MARVTHIQTGTERAQGHPGAAHDEDLHDRMQATASRIAQRITETKAGIEESRARVAYLTEHGRWPS